MHIQRVIVGIVSILVAISFAYFPITYMDWGLLVLGALFFLWGMRVTTETTPAPAGERGQTTWTGRTYGLIFSGIIFILAFLNLKFSFFTYALAGFDINSIVLLVWGVLMLVFGFRKY